MRGHGIEGLFFNDGDFASYQMLVMSDTHTT
jgi:hypothetical protein